MKDETKKCRKVLEKTRKRMERILKRSRMNREKDVEDSVLTHSSLAES